MGSQPSRLPAATHGSGLRCSLQPVELYWLDFRLVLHPSDVGQRGAHLRSLWRPSNRSSAQRVAGVYAVAASLPFVWRGTVRYEQ